MVTALYGRGRLDNSMCTENPKGGCKADMCDYVKRLGGMDGKSARPHGMLHALSEHTVRRNKKER